MPDDRLTAAELREIWAILSPAERVESFEHTDRSEVHSFFLSLSGQEQAALLLAMRSGERRLWMRLLAPDDAADVIQLVPPEDRAPFLEMLDEPTRREVTALMAYAEDAAGGLMSPRFARLRPDMKVGEAIRYLQRQAQEKLETIYYAYVLDQEQRLLGVVSFRDLFVAPGDRPVSDVMRRDVVSVPDTLDQEAVAHVIARHDLNALPVVDAGGRMKGIVTVDDIVDVVQQAATEDIQKLGGMEALDTPYMQTSMLAMVKKRAGWLSALFLGEMLTASAMGHYEEEIARAVVLALFVPLIISSGGNSGSQATTLIIRAMALGEVTIKDWWRIVRRELTAGLSLGVILATIGLVRILVWQAVFHTYGEHYLEVAATVAISLVGIVTWGTLAGSMLPFAIRRLGFDPASASAPFVATLVDVSGLIIYFNVAQIVLQGTLL
ncbi:MULTISPECIES: magnesium transporter [Sorangium]|uniref:Magnesium transporter MgtE n=1 Tax=Sorangium cellulosum TaxID=56 RepID=A0A4P2QJ04_SORCE|nr:MULTISPECIES: magnesium transporter [Sorangium]AUX29920.1 magnesium transporter [Sorangium cellulosum]WCQ89308.1 Magnesium transporter MgtE [Sorangium sp. Soce836]